MEIGGMEIKSCPFCGCAYFYIERDVTTTKTYLAHVVCLECYCKSAEGSDGIDIENAVKEAIEAWNKRVSK